MSVITLTTDFGTHDWFVGTMKGVIAGVAPETTVIDITHDLPRGDVRAGAFALAAAAPHFPPGTIHVVVVDPGVGSARRALAVRTADAILVGPDNGVLGWALRDGRDEETREIAQPAWQRHPVSRTFHGRDIFAPAAAHLARGAAFAELGAVVTDRVPLPWPLLVTQPRGCTGEVIHVDRFGNALTNIPGDAVPPAAVRRDTVEVRLAGARSVPLGDFYAAVEPGRPVAVAGSSGFIEIAVRDGHAARELGLKPGEPVAIVW